MRQTSFFRAIYNYQRLLLCVVLLFFSIISSLLYADVSGVACIVSGYSAGDVLNQNAVIVVKTTWQGDTPPFSCELNYSGTPLDLIGGIYNNGVEKSYPASNFNVNSCQITATVTEESSGKTANGSSETIYFNFLNPVLNVTLGGNPPYGGTNNKVPVFVTCSNVGITQPTVTCNGVSANLKQQNGTSYEFELDISSFANSTTPYRVRATAKSDTKPAEYAPEGSGECDLLVGSGANGNTEIDTQASTQSPTNATSITIKGKSPELTRQVAILVDGAEATRQNAGPDWSIVLDESMIPNGKKRIVAVSYDEVGNEISRSPEYQLTVDRIPPEQVTVDETSGIPTNTNQPKITIPVNVTVAQDEITPPILLQPLVNGAPVGNPMPVNQTGVVNIDVPLTGGPNTINFTTTDGAGNVTTSNTNIIVNQNSSASGIVTSVVVEGIGVPFISEGENLNSNKFIGPGEHSILVYFDNSVSDAIPTIEITCEGGSKITVNGSWDPDTFRLFNGSFTVPNNGGTTFDGKCQLDITNVKDIYGNILQAYSQPGAFPIDSTPPTSTITSDTPIYVSGVKNKITLQGEVNDGDNGSGVESVDLIIRDSANAPVSIGSNNDGIINIPLNLAQQSPWTKEVDFSGLNTAGKYTIVSRAKDKAINIANVENIDTKTKLSLIVDLASPTVSKISLGNSDFDIPESDSKMVVASDVSRIVATFDDEAESSGIDFTKTTMTLTDPKGSTITGEFTNNGTNKMYFDFPSLTATGEYKIVVTPFDNAGNSNDPASRTFILVKSGPDGMEMQPPNQTIANHTDPNLAVSQVKITLTSTDSAITPSYEQSTVSVKYNGLEVGSKSLTSNSDGQTQPTESDEENPPAEEGAAMYARLHGTAANSLKDDGSHDGTYYVTVVPKSSQGLAGETINQSFVYDTQPPVIVESSPDIGTSETEEIWFGNSTTAFTIKLSDSPKDILDYYRGQYPVASIPVAPEDSTWYSSRGSGVNTNVSTFTWSTGNGESQSNFSVDGDKLILTAPNFVNSATYTSGVEPINVTIRPADNANQGETVPNWYIISRNFKYDYIPPTLKIIGDGKKFCKKVATIKGEVSDIGDGAQVVKILVSEDGGNTWGEVSTTNLPSANASFPMSLDIPNKDDGTYTVKFKAIDKGGNTSEEIEATYIVDRTPLEPPELTVPLADYSTNKRSQGFRWASVTGANAYLLQIADDSSFSNIVNHATNASYTDLKGAVCNTPDSSFSLPKDGTFYWRVASIENCEDGYNVGNFSETRKIIIDTVKPYILSVTPTPSSSNTVSTGMVTFTIRFNEVLDGTIDFSATLTSAGGQVMKIEKVSCTGDTWTGTTVIPKNNSAVYDGSAVITVEGATDLAGNAMALDSSHSIVVNTGPAFTTKLFSNPANEFEITIITKSSESLQAAPSVTVVQNSVKTPVTMNFLKDRFYTGSYKIDKESPGSAYIKISGTDLYGMVGNSTVEFVVADVNASTRLSIADSTGRASIKAAAGATAKPTAIYIISREMLESPFVTNSNTDLTNASLRASAGVRMSTYNSSGSELIGILGLDEIGPKSTKLKKCMLYTADLNGEVIDLSKADKIHVYRQDSNGNWIFQGGELKDYKISAQITGLGRLALMADTTAPRAASFEPSNKTKLDTSFPEIKGQFVDNGSGLVTSSFKLYIDDLQVKNVEMEKDGSFSYQVKQMLKEGDHEIKYEVSDKAGNSLVRAVTVNAPMAIRAGEFSPYPSPARGNRINFVYYFGAMPDSASLKIYDSSGHLVKTFGIDDFNLLRGSIRWDLKNKKGKRIANGTYIYKLEVTAGGQKFKKRGKFAVLK